MNGNRSDVRGRGLSGRGDGDSGRGPRLKDPAGSDGLPVASDPAAYREAHRRSRVVATLLNWDPATTGGQVAMAFDRACRESNVDHGFEDPDMR